MFCPEGIYFAIISAEYFTALYHSTTMLK